MINEPTATFPRSAEVLQKDWGEKSVLYPLTWRPCMCLIGRRVVVSRLLGL